MPAMKAQPEWLRASFTSPQAQVDREKKMLRGYVVAQAGIFKDRRGEFNAEGLKQIAAMGNREAKGLKSRFTHPTLSSDGLGKFLGRVRNLRMDKATDARTGKRVDAVRADLHFDETAFKTPSGDLATYIMDLAESDPDALSSSIVIKPREEAQLDRQGRPLTDEDGNERPMLWFPEELHASDLVDTGDAVDGLLSAGIDMDSLPDAVVRRGAEMLDRLFGNESRDVIEARCQAWLQRYLALRFDAEPVATPKMDALREQLDRMAAMSSK